ncbi:S8 family serine peptidase [Tersicoccus sp. MR15.9]|uniref:S8 family serine peptidase n=1 Tax=Tersicoccus mangrovi TaxID=3121635 RepID=UPI002FE5998F
MTERNPTVAPARPQTPDTRLSGAGRSRARGTRIARGAVTGLLTAVLGGTGWLLPVTPAAAAGGPVPTEPRPTPAATRTTTPAAPSATATADTRTPEYWMHEYGFDEAQKVSRGAGVKVAVIDTGIATDHPDLAGAVVGGTDVSGTGAADGSRPIGFESEHATMVATLLAGRGHVPASAASSTSSSSKSSPTGSGSTDASGRTAGMLGVAPEAQLLNVSAWVGDGNPGGRDIMDQIPAAVRWSVDHGARVISMSLTSTSTSWPRSWDEAFAYAEQKDVLVVAAAGNRAGGITQVGAPATMPGVLAVGGLDRQGKASWDASAQGISIGVSAPSENLVGGLPGGGYRTWAGTSAATPLISGLAALIRSRWPELSAGEVANRIVSTAHDEGAPGRDPIYGFGAVDAAKALTADVPQSSGDPLGSISEWIRVHRRASDPQVTAPAAAATRRSAQAVPVPAAPTPRRPVWDGGIVPGLIVVGFGALLVVIAGAAAVHLNALRRRR